MVFTSISDFAAHILLSITCTPCPVSVSLQTILLLFCTPEDAQQVDIKHKKHQLSHGKRVEDLEFVR